MDEKTLNAASTQSSTASNWFSNLINAAATTGQTYLNRNKPAGSTTVVSPASGGPNWTVIGIGAGVVVLLLVFVMARK